MPKSWLAELKKNVYWESGAPGRPGDRPAGQRARDLLDVVLRVPAALAEREELHQLAGVVLVGPVPGARPVVEPDEHCRVLRHREHEVVESGDRERALGPVLGEHQRGLFHLRERGREDLVPEVRHLLFERPRRVDHAVEEPPLESSRAGQVVRGVRLTGLHRREAGQVGLEHAVVDPVEVDEPVHGRVQPDPYVRIQLRGRGPEAGAPRQMGGGFAVPGDAHGEFPLSAGGYAAKRPVAPLYVSPIHESQVRPAGAEDRLRVGAEPVRQDRPVIGAEIVLDAQVPIRVEAGEVGRRAVEAR